MKNTNHNKELRAKFAKKQRPTILPTKVAHLVNDSLAILFFALGVMLVMALLSYSPNDPCWSKSTSTNALAVNNQLGVFGSYMSDILLYNFGYSAWWLVLGTFYFGTQQIMRKFLDAGNLISPYRFICGLILIFASATFEFVVFYGQKTQLPSSWGGSFGSFLFSNLSNLFGEVGVNLLSLLTIAICLSFVFGISWLTIAEKVGEKIEMLLVRSQNLPTISPEKSSLINDEQNVASSPELNTTAHNYFASATVVDSSTTDVFQPQPQDTVDEYDPLGLNFAIPETTNQSTATQTKEYSSLIGNLFKPNPLTNNHNLNEELSTPNTTNNQAHNSGYDNQLLNTKPISSTTNGFNLDDKLFNSVNSSPQANSSTIKNKSADIVTHLESNLASLGVKININNVLTGPIITRYEFIPPRGVNRDQIINLTPQLAQAMSLADLSMLKNIPDKSCMAIEIPNPERSLINLTELLNLASFQNTNNLLPLILGKDSVGELVITD
ncbi:MAG: FtsK, partial [Pseudomonadota bacterium]